jgi:hypothetical protein
MKKTILAFVIALIAVSATAQTFTASKVDSVAKSKDELYTSSKMFIAQTWKSAKDVIQMDDKEGGVIIIKGKSIQERVFQLNNHVWVYSYTITIQIKDGKYRISASDVICDRAYCGAYEWPLVPITEPSTYPGKRCGIGEERYNEINDAVKNEMKGIISSYSEFVNKKIELSDF